MAGARGRTVAGEEEQEIVMSAMADIEGGKVEFDYAVRILSALFGVVKGQANERQT